MQTLFSAIMGLVQGLAEFLPISSSGHLLITEKLLALAGYDVASSRSLQIMLHVGTLLAVAAVFWKDWVQMLLHPIKNKTLLLLFIASLPALFAMLLAGDLIDQAFSGWFLGPAFLVTALFLYIAENAGKSRHAKKSGEITVARAMTMGCFQAVALLPGVSRSGSTLLGGLLGGLTRSMAAKFSFMMSAPAILGSFLAEVKDAAENGQMSSLFSFPILVGVAVAAVSGYLAIRFMLRLIETISLTRFSVYLVAVGVLVIICQLTGFAGFPPLAFPGTAP